MALSFAYSTSSAAPTKRPFVSVTLCSLSILESSTAQHELSDKLLENMKSEVQNSKTTMLPSYIYRLPDGSETGHAVGIDLGGSTLRVSLISFPQREVLRRQVWTIDEEKKKLPAKEFFDWIAARVRVVVGEEGMGEDGDIIPVGLTWSFPMDQTSLWDGKVKTMGKGYLTHQGIEGSSLREHFHAGFRKQGLTKLTITAVMNDAEATLLSHNQSNPNTRVSVLCGTGLNAAIQLPVSAIAPHKIEKRPEAWKKVAKSCLVNTECSMFGGDGILPLIDADYELDAAQEHPGYQPLEQLVGGRNLGEICRLILVKAAKEGAVFEGKLPKMWEERLGFGSDVMGHFEEDLSVEKASELLELSDEDRKTFTEQDRNVITSVCRGVARRAAAILAITLYTLLRLEWESWGKTEEVTSVAYTGSILEKHPNIRHHCLKFLKELVGADKKVDLEEAVDASLLGAAVGALMNKEEALEEKA